MINLLNFCEHLNKLIKFLCKLHEYPLHLYHVKFTFIIIKLCNQLSECFFFCIVTYTDTNSCTVRFTDTTALYMIQIYYLFFLALIMKKKSVKNCPDNTVVWCILFLNFHPSFCPFSVSQKFWKLWWIVFFLNDIQSGSHRLKYLNKDIQIITISIHWHYLTF